jgi:hypothetical protein
MGIVVTILAMNECIFIPIYESVTHPSEAVNTFLQISSHLGGVGTLRTCTMFLDCTLEVVLSTLFAFVAFLLPKHLGR